MAGKYLEGHRVVGTYLDLVTVTGVVRESRIKLGGELIHYVDLSSPVTLREGGRPRDSLIIKDTDILEVVS